MTQSHHRYRRVSSIGFGAMGEVWLANDEVLGRRVAVKQLRVDASNGMDAHAVERMVREARTAAGLHHRHIVSVFDMYTIDGQPNIVMEFVDGVSLAQRIKHGPALTVDEVARLGAEIASALALAHQRGVVHRDVKPANILLEADGTAKLADFGIARRLGDAALTDTGNMIGTIAFMAPEVARSNQASAASDMWSLGATLFAAIEGHSPYDDGSNPTTAQLLIRLVTEPAPVSGRGGHLAPLLSAMMKTDPMERLTAGEVTASFAASRSSSVRPAETEAAAGLESNHRDDAEPKTRLRPFSPEQPAPGDNELATLRRVVAAPLRSTSATELDDPTAAMSRIGAPDHPMARSVRRTTRLQVPIVAAFIVAAIGVIILVAVAKSGTHAKEAGQSPSSVAPQANSPKQQSVNSTSNRTGQRSTVAKPLFSGASVTTRHVVAESRGTFPTHLRAVSAASRSGVLEITLRFSRPLQTSTGFHLLLATGNHVNCGSRQFQGYEISYEGRAIESSFDRSGCNYRRTAYLVGVDAVTVAKRAFVLRIPIADIKLHRKTVTISSGSLEPCGSQTCGVDFVAPITVAVANS